MDPEKHNEPIAVTSDTSSDDISAIRESILAATPEPEGPQIGSFQDFVNDMNVAFKGVLGKPKQYLQATVLFFRWEDDLLANDRRTPGVQREINQLEQVLIRDYGFSSETYLIPSQDSQQSLENRVDQFCNEHKSQDELLAVYYGGRGASNSSNQSLWQQGNGPEVDWSSIEKVLRYAMPDIAIFLDCYSSVFTDGDELPLNRTIETLAAGCEDSTTIGHPKGSFTKILTTTLKDSVDKPLTLSMLHAKLVNNEANDGTKSLVQAPIHSIISDNNRPSIRLYPVKLGSPSPSPLSLHDLSAQCSLSGWSGIFPGTDPLLSALVAVRIGFPVQNIPYLGDLLTDSMPPDVTNLQLIKAEGVWGTSSTLGLIAMSTAIWNLLPRTDAYQLIDYITTPNLLSNHFAITYEDLRPDQVWEWRTRRKNEALSRAGSRPYWAMPNLVLPQIIQRHLKIVEENPSLLEQPQAQRTEYHVIRKLNTFRTDLDEAFAPAQTKLQEGLEEERQAALSQGRIKHKESAMKVTRANLKIALWLTFLSRKWLQRNLSNYAVSEIGSPRSMRWLQ